MLRWLYKRLSLVAVGLSIYQWIRYTKLSALQSHMPLGKQLSLVCATCMCPECTKESCYHTPLNSRGKFNCTVVGIISTFLWSFIFLGNEMVDNHNGCKVFFNEKFANILYLNLHWTYTCMVIWPFIIFLSSIFA